MKSFLIVIFFIVFTVGCKRKITDLMEALESYGYKSSIPIDTKAVPVENNLLGAYEYNSVPIIISQKDKTTYLIKFLQVELNKEDRDVEAKMTVLNGQKFLNLYIGDFYSFLKVELSSELLNIKMLRREVKREVSETELKKWLTQNGNKFSFVSKDSTNIDLYHELVFQKITSERAYQIQKEKLEEAKKELFVSCHSYDEYDRLIVQYPDDPYLPEAVQSLYRRCVSERDYEKFVAAFPDAPQSKQATVKLTAIRTFKKDSIGYYTLRSKGSIEDCQAFLKDCQTEKFRALTESIIIDYVSAIKKDDIEWKWTSGQHAIALQYIKYKIDYEKQIDVNWYIDHLLFYSLKSSVITDRQDALNYLNKLAEINLTSDNYLSLYLARGFIIWVNGNPSEALDIFKVKSLEKFTGSSLRFKDAVLERQKYLKSQNIVFPEEKSTLKQIKSMK